MFQCLKKYPEVSCTRDLRKLIENLKPALILAGTANIEILLDAGFFICGKGSLRGPLKMAFGIRICLRNTI